MGDLVSQAKQQLNDVSNKVTSAPVGVLITAGLLALYSAVGVNYISGEWLTIMTESQIAKLIMFALVIVATLVSPVIGALLVIAVLTTIQAASKKAIKDTFRNIFRQKLRNRYEHLDAVNSDPSIIDQALAPIMTSDVETVQPAPSQISLVSQVPSGLDTPSETPSQLITGVYEPEECQSLYPEVNAYGPQVKCGTKNAGAYYAPIPESPLCSGTDIVTSASGERANTIAPLVNQNPEITQRSSQGEVPGFDSQHGLASF